MSVPLGGLRTIANAALTQTCAVRRYTETNTPDGVEQGWADVLTGVRCLIAPRARTAAEEAQTGVTLGRSDWTLWLPYGTDVKRVDRLAVDAPDGRVFEVQRVDARTNEVLRVCQCMLVD